MGLKYLPGRAALLLVQDLEPSKELLHRLQPGRVGGQEDYEGLEAGSSSQYSLLVVDGCVVHDEHHCSRREFIPGSHCLQSLIDEVLIHC